MPKIIEISGADAQLVLDIAESLYRYLSNTGGYQSREDAAQRANELRALLLQNITV